MTDEARVQILYKIESCGSESGASRGSPNLGRPCFVSGHAEKAEVPKAQTTSGFDWLQTDTHKLVRESRGELVAGSAGEGAKKEMVRRALRICFGSCAGVT